MERFVQCYFLSSALDTGPSLGRYNEIPYPCGWVRIMIPPPPPPGLGPILLGGVMSYPGELRDLLL